MMLRTAAASFVLLNAFTAFGQTQQALPAFEVASIKPAPPPSGMAIMVGMRTAPGRVELSNVTLKDIIRQAFIVKDYQIAGPDWLNGTRFDIVAKVPADTPKDQIPLMLQSLLAERFKLVVHRETKELPMYSLVVAKNGPKLQKADESAEASTIAPPLPPGGPAAGGGASFNMQRGPGGKAGATMQMGRGHLAAKMTTTSALADMLARQLSRPVTDMTGLTDKYDFTLDWSPEEGESNFKQAVAGESLSASSTPSAPAPDGVTAPSIFSAVQSQLGLKLDARKGPVETIVVDHLEKVPTEN